MHKSWGNAIWFEDAAEKLYEWYQTPKEDRDKAGLEGREWMLREDTCLSANRMCERFIEDMETAFEKWTPRKQFKLYEA